MGNLEDTLRLFLKAYNGSMKLSLRVKILLNLDIKTQNLIKIAYFSL